MSNNVVLEPGISWQSRMGNNPDGIGGNNHQYINTTLDGTGAPIVRSFVVDWGVKFGGGTQGRPYAAEFASPVGVLAHARRGVEGGGAAPEAIVITHPHEDHIGALRHLVRMGYQLPPIYASPFSAEMITKSFANTGLRPEQFPDLRVVQPGETVDVAGARVTFVPVSHMPQASALLIETPDARVLHTGDFKFDGTVKIGPPADLERLRAIGAEGVDMLIADSTSAGQTEDRPTEEQCYEGLSQVVGENQGRAIVAGILGSQLDRFVSLARAAAANDRKLVVSGKSLQDCVASITKAGYDLTELTGAEIITPRQAEHLPPASLLVVTTGAFAQPGAGLTRAAAGENRNLHIDANTTVIIPQRAIPPVEKEVAAMLEGLRATGARVITAEESAAAGVPIYVSGHASDADERTMIDAVKPALYVPIHGDPGQIEENAAIGQSLGIPVLALDRNDTLIHVDHAHGAEIDDTSYPVDRIGVHEIHEPGAPVWKRPWAEYDKLSPSGTVQTDAFGAHHQAHAPVAPALMRAGA